MIKNTIPPRPEGRGILAKNLMKKIILLMLLCISTSVSAKMDLAEYKNGFFRNQENKGKTVKMTSNFNGQEFTYFSNISNDINKTNLYILLHGEYSKTEKFFEITGLHNEFKKYGNFISFDSPKDDWYEDPFSKNNSKTFIEKLIKVYSNNFNIRNVYIVGYSSGATLANEILCGNKIKINGIVNFAGTITSEIEDCKIDLTNFKYLQVSGSKDDFYGFNNLNERNNNYKEAPYNSFPLLLSQDKIGTFFNCKNSVEIDMYDKDIEDYSNIIKKDYQCKENSKNKYRVLNVLGMGHNWFKHRDYDYNDFRGKSNGDIDFSKYMFDYLLN